MMIFACPVHSAVAILKQAKAKILMYKESILAVWLY